MTQACNPRCQKCNGKGGWLVTGRWVRCTCTRPSKTVQAIIRKANEQEGRPWRSPFSR